MSDSTPGTLLLVATPIGNLADLTPRAAEALCEVGLIAAEDSRKALTLLRQVGSEVPVTAYNDSSGPGTRRKLLDQLLAGTDVALISAAGTPLISDPGYRLVAQAVEAGIPVRPLPGPSAVIAALAASGLATDRFVFEGFPPRAAGRRRQWLEELRSLRCTAVIFESPARLPGLLTELAGALGEERPAVLAQELTKLYERFVRAPLGELSRRADSGELVLKGEAVLVLGGAESSPGTHAANQPGEEALLRAFLEVCSPAEAAKRVAALTGVARRRLYDRAKEMSGEPAP